MVFFVIYVFFFQVKVLKFRNNMCYSIYNTFQCCGNVARIFHRWVTFVEKCSMSAQTGVQARMRNVLSISAACTDTFDSIANTNALNGVIASDSTVNTLSECRAFCLDRTFSSCAGFDFNDRTDECWIHVEDNLVSSNRRTNFDTDLYIRERCGNFDISPLCHIAKVMFLLLISEIIKKSHGYKEKLIYMVLHLIK